MYNLKLLPRWVIFLIDMSIIAFSAMLGYLLRFNFNIQDILDSNSDFMTGVSLYLA